MAIPWPFKRKRPQPARPDPEQTIRTAPAPFASVATTEARLLNDDSVYSVFNVFTDVLFGAGWHWEGKDAERAAPLLDQITGAEGFGELLDELAAVCFQRMAVVEIVWRTTPDWTPMRYRVVPVGSARVDLDALGDPERITVTTTAGLQEVPMENCVFHRYRPTFAKPLGQSVYDHLKEVVDFKRRTDAAIVRDLERFGAPSIVGYYPPGLPKEKQGDLLKALRDLQAASVGTIPGPKGERGSEIEILEPQGTGGGIGVALEMIKQYERRIARAVLGSVLAVYESEFGTRAQADVHWEVLKAVVQSFQQGIEAPLQAQVVERVIAYNLGEADVQFRLNPPSYTDLQKLGQWVADLTTAGFLDPGQDADAVRAMFNLEPLKEPLPEPEPNPATPPAAPDTPPEGA